MNAEFSIGARPSPMMRRAPSNTVTLFWQPGQDKPNIRRNGWILDSTLQPEAHGFFYRVVDVTDAGPNAMNVEVQTTFRGNFVPVPNNPTLGLGTVMVIDNVVEVFEKGTY